jgi:hypothetical protein
LHKTDSRALHIALLVEILGFPAIFFSIIYHFCIKDLGAQKFDDEFSPCLVGSN